MLTKGQILFIMLLLLLVVIAFITLHQPFDKPKGEKAAVRAPSGFLDYDLIPEVLKQKMIALKAAHPHINYSFWYFFDIEDVNKHYYLSDSDVEVVYALPVSDPKVLALLDEKMQNDPGIDVTVARHPDMMINPATTKEEREAQVIKFREHKDDPSWVWIHYIFPEDTVDFSRLKVAIVEQVILPYSNTSFLSVVRNHNEVDTLPAPIRGYDYFEEVMVKELMKYDVFTFYDLKGKVTIEFTIGASPSPNIVEGFSTRKDSYEAYQADGAFIKVLNKLKVRWKPGKQGNSPVAVRMPITFQVDGQTIKMKKEPNVVADL